MGSHSDRFASYLRFPSISRAFAALTAFCLISCDVPAGDPLPENWSNVVIYRNGSWTPLTDSLSCGISQFCLGDSMVVFPQRDDFHGQGGVRVQLVILSIDKSIKRTALTGFFSIGTPTVSPDSRWGLVNASETYENEYIYRVDFETGSTTQLPVQGSGISIAPDGNSFLCVEHRDTIMNGFRYRRDEVMRYAIDGTAGTVVVRGVLNTEIHTAYVLPNGGIIYEKGITAQYDGDVILYIPPGDTTAVVVGEVYLASVKNLVAGMTRNVAAYGPRKPGGEVIWVDLDSSVVSTTLTGVQRPLQFLRGDQSLLAVDFVFPHFVSPMGSSGVIFVPPSNMWALRAADSTLFVGVIAQTVYRE